MYGLFAIALNGIYDLKVFSRTSSSIFAAAVGGLFALMGGALILNVMFNLSRIADSLAQPLYKLKSINPTTQSPIVSTIAAPDTACVSVKQPESRAMRFWLVMFFVGFGLISVLLFAGDIYTRKTKQRLMTNVVTTIIQERQARFTSSLHLPFNVDDLDGLQTLQKQLVLIEQSYRQVDRVSLLVPVNYQNETVILHIDRDHPSILRADAAATADANIELPKPVIEIEDNLFAAEPEQRQWIFAAFKGQKTAPLYQYDGSRYELFYPIKIGHQWAVLYLFDQQYYGKVSY